MRLWTLHPKYLDSKGLVSAWREGLLAKKVLEEKTHGYKNHPQLSRFKESENPIDSINSYLEHLYEESLVRGYKFNKDKIITKTKNNKELIKVTKGQVIYEWKLLLYKLKERNNETYNQIKDIAEIEVNGIFKIVEGNVAEWEKVKPYI